MSVEKLGFALYRPPTKRRRGPGVAFVRGGDPAKYPAIQTAETMALDPRIPPPMEPGVPEQLLLMR